MAANAPLDFHLQLIQEIEQAKPTLSRPEDAIVLLLHLSLKRLQFRCVGTSESSRDESVTGAFAPEGWNKSEDAYVLTYKHPKSSMHFVLKCLKMGGNLLINGIALEDNKIHSMEIDSLSYTRKNPDLADYKTIFKDAGALLRQFKANIIDKLLPGLNKEGFESASTTNTTTAPQRNEPARPRPRYDDDPLRIDPLREPSRTPNRPYVPMGHEDLYPNVGGFNIPSVPGMGPNFGGGAGGSQMGPNHPMFHPDHEDDYNLPRPGIRPPPGARFDPFGPPGNHFGGPNNDHFPPPGFGGNMYL